MNRLRFILIFLCTLLLGWITVASFHIGEPGYQGKSITTWSEIAFDEAHNVIVPDTNQVDSMAAISIIGPRAIPTYLKFAKWTDSQAKSKLILWLRDHDFTRWRTRIYDQDDRRNMALRGFYALGTNASSAVPALLNLLKDEDEEVRANAIAELNVVMADKKELSIVLSNELKDPSAHVQYTAALTLNNLDPQTAAAARVYQIFPELIKFSHSKIKNESASNK